jgi:hypothetical protein
VYAALWRFLLGIDLARSLAYDRRASTSRCTAWSTSREAGPQVTRRPSGSRSSTCRPRWRPRRYLTPVDVVLEVTDPLLPANAGRWRLTGGPTRRLRAHRRVPDLALSITDLGALYLGGTSLGVADRGRPGAPADRNIPYAAFGWHRLPNPIEVF